jgi:hypothetical protein
MRSPREAEQPRDLLYMQLAVVEVTDCKIATQVLKYFSEVQTFVRKPSRKRFLAHSPACEQHLPRQSCCDNEIDAKLNEWENGRSISGLPCAQRTSSLKVFPSTYPASHSPVRKASNAGDFRACLLGQWSHSEGHGIGRIRESLVSHPIGRAGIIFFNEHAAA